MWWWGWSADVIRQEVWLVSLFSSGGLSLLLLLLLINRTLITQNPFCDPGHVLSSSCCSTLIGSVGCFLFPRPEPRFSAGIGSRLPRDPLSQQSSYAHAAVMTSQETRLTPFSLSLPLKVMRAVRLLISWMSRKTGGEDSYKSFFYSHWWFNMNRRDENNGSDWKDGQKKHKRWSIFEIPEGRDDRMSTSEAKHEKPGKTAAFI